MTKLRKQTSRAANTLENGPPKGSRNMKTGAQLLLERFEERLMRKCIAQAFQGDQRSMKLCLGRLPVRRQSTVRIRLPDVKTARGVDAALQAVIDAVTAGQMPPSDGVKLANILENRRKSIATRDLTTTVEQLEHVAEKSNSRSQGMHENRREPPIEGRNQT